MIDQNLMLADYQSAFVERAERLSNFWPRRAPSTAAIIRYLMDQHGVTRAQLVPILGTASRVSEVLRGKKGLSMAMMQRLRARFRVPAEVLLPPIQKQPARRSKVRATA